MGCIFFSLNLSKPVTVVEMRKIEDQGTSLGISKLVMMENAGAAIANYLNERLSSEKGSHRTKEVVVVGGTGNNGGDVFVAARHLAYWPYFQVTAVLIGTEKQIHTEEALTNWKILTRISKIKRILVDKEAKLVVLGKELSKANVVVAGIFGTGFRGRPKGLQLGVIKQINAIKRPLKVSADLPSGMEADTGNSTCCVRSDVTVTMHAPKRGLLLSESNAGKIIVANIGIPI